jgi:hypothetical protein
MKAFFVVLLLSFGFLTAYAQTITAHDEAIETFVDETNYIRIFSKIKLVSYELWDLSRDKRKLSQVINAPDGSKASHYVIINPRRLKEGDYMIKLIRPGDVQKVWFSLPKFKERSAQLID